MHIEPLASHLQLIPLIAENLHREWGDRAPWSDPVAIVERLRCAAGTAVFPYALVAISTSGAFMGTATVKLNEVFSHSDKHHWLGEVYVPMPLRGRGIATRLIEQIVAYAFSSGAPCLYLYTPDQQELYRKLGWEPCCQEVVDDEEVTIMVRSKTPSPK